MEKQTTNERTIDWTLPWTKRKRNTIWTSIFISHQVLERWLWWYSFHSPTKFDLSLTNLCHLIYSVKCCTFFGKINGFAWRIYNFSRISMRFKANEPWCWCFVEKITMCTQMSTSISSIDVIVILGGIWIRNENDVCVFGSCFWRSNIRFTDYPIYQLLNCHSSRIRVCDERINVN